MIRFVLENRWKNGLSGAEGGSIRTLDIDVPELEQLLISGGHSESSYDLTDLIGVEILQEGS